MLRVASCTGLSPSMELLSKSFHSQHFMQSRGPTTPSRALRHRRFGLLPGRSPLLGESLLFSLPQGTKMFQFPWLASAKKADDSTAYCQVVLFGDLRIKGYLHLPADFRSLSRPSSPVRA